MSIAGEEGVQQSQGGEVSEEEEEGRELERELRINIRYLPTHIVLEQDQPHRARGLRGKAATL